jgi:acetyl-CoA acetyltransferase
MMGCGFPDHEQGYNIGRNALLLSGIDHHVPAVTVSRFCASSLQTIRMAFHAIKAGEGDQYIAGGRGVRVAGRGHDYSRNESADRRPRTARGTTCTSRWGSRPRTLLRVASLPRVPG